MIESRRNPQLKDIRRLKRCKDDSAVLEGPHLVSEAAAAGLELTSVLATPEFLAGAGGRRLLPLLRRRPLEVAPRLLAEVTDSDSPRGVVAVARLPRYGVAALPVIAGGVYVYAEALQDPGNLGALARVAEAAGAAGVCLGPGSVHPNHPRALRASAGSLLRLCVATRSSAAELAERLVEVAPRWLALVPSGGRDVFTAALARDTLVIALGGEGPGLSATVRARAEARLTVPVAAPVESLNATVAAAIVLYEIHRQRSHDPCYRSAGTKTT